LKEYGKTALVGGLTALGGYQYLAPTTSWVTVGNRLAHPIETMRFATINRNL